MEECPVMNENENDITVTNPEESAETETPVENEIVEQTDPVDASEGSATEEALPESEAESLAENAEQSPTDALKAASEEEKRKTYRTGSAVTAFILFAITAVIFAFFITFVLHFLIEPLREKANDLGEAIAIVFVLPIGIAATIVTAIVQLPENIASLIMFNRLRHRSDKKKQRVLFTVFFAISIVMLILAIVTVPVFLLAANG